jgi:IclR family acetate operon transcriptional repressor
MISSPDSAKAFDAAPSPTGAKMLAVMELLSQNPEGITAAEATRQTGLTADLVARLLRTLAEAGYATRREDNKAFVLSNRFLNLAHPRSNDQSLVLCAHEALTRLRDETGETVQLMIEANGKGLVLDQKLGNHALQVCGKVGMRIPLYSCAPGKAILAWWGEKRRADWFRGRALKQFTPTTLSRRKDLERNLEQSVARGYTADVAEGNEGIHCVAAPILDPFGNPVAAITVMAPIVRMPEDDFERFGGHCIVAARQVEQRLRN